MTFLTNDLSAQFRKVHHQTNISFFKKKNKKKKKNSCLCFVKGKIKGKTQSGQVLVGQFQDIFKQIPVQYSSALNSAIEEIQVSRMSKETWTF